MNASGKNESVRWISARHLQHFIARGQAAGLSVDDWLKEAGLEKSSLADAEAVVPVSAMESLLATLSAHYDLPLIGLHLANDIQPATLGPLGHIAQACSNFGDVLEMMVRFNGLLSNIGRLSLQHHPGTVEVCWECLAGSEAFQRVSREYVIGAFVVLGRFLLPEHRDLIRSVNFPHSRPRNADHSRGYFTFFRCPVYFDRPTSSVLIPARLLDIRMPHGDAHIKHLLEQHAERTIRERELEHSLSDEVRHLIRSMLMDGNPTKAMVATQLGMSSRTLQRKLDESGTSYRDLLHRVRLELAREYLNTRSISVDTVAGRMGFASRQAFLRWFKQSTGYTPSQFRKESECQQQS